MSLPVGIVNYIANQRYSAQVVNAFIGAGNRIYIAAGGLVAIRNILEPIRVVQYSNTGNAFTVGDNGVNRAAAQGNLFLTNRLLEEEWLKRLAIESDSGYGTISVAGTNQKTSVSKSGSF